MTQPLKANLGTMMQQSAYVLARPSAASFERFERSGGVGQAFTYVAVVALVAGVFALLFNLGNAPFWAFLERSLVLIAGFATAPYAGAHFNRFAAFGLLANLLAVPAMAVLVMPGAVILALGAMRNRY